MVQNAKTMSFLREFRGSFKFVHLLETIDVTGMWFWDLK